MDTNGEKKQQPRMAGIREAEFQTTDDTDYTDENDDEDTKFARE